MNLFNIIDGHYIVGDRLTIETFQADHRRSVEWMNTQNPVLRRGKIVWGEVPIIVAAWSQASTNGLTMNTEYHDKLREVGAGMLGRLNSQMAVYKHHETIINSVVNGEGAF